MTIPRRDFLRTAAVAGVGGSALGPAAGLPIGSEDGLVSLRDQEASYGKSVHTVLNTNPSFIYVDPCMQIWPDADLDTAHRHGVTAYGVTAWDPHADVAAATDGIMYWHGAARENAGLEVVKTVSDIRRLKAEGKSGLLLAAQDGDWVGYDLGRIQAFADLGLRMMLLVYNATNQLADGALDRTDGGLSRLGQRVVDECNRVGIILDCSHTGKRATLEIMDRSAHPCVFTHSNPSAIVPNPRNIDDEQIRACLSGNGVVALVALLAVLIGVTAGVVAMTMGARKIPVQIPRKVVGRGRIQEGQKSFIPLRVNSAGVMPIIFAQAFIVVPGTLAAFSSLPFLQSVADMFQPQTLTYYITYGLLIVFFTYFYTAIIFNPVDLAENLKKQGGFIPGVKPGARTAEYIDRVLTRVTLPGSIYLALIALSPFFIFDIFKIQTFFFGGTGLLIVVGVALDTVQQAQQHLMLRHYDGFMKKGRVKMRGRGKYM